ncbi:MAG: aspartate kinase, partial [Thermoguttaceae bacterium]|nr:aspartate kinase [Thermoguttaceae bacterium]
GKIVIAAGFQGIDDDFNITTLGRGGSDTTAASLAAALNADRCDIYTDVDGVYTTDPRIVPEARCVDRICYDEMLELASMGAGVMHSRSIEFAKKFGVQIQVRSSFSDNPGTIIGPEPESFDAPVCGVALARDEARFTIIGVPDVPGVAMKLFASIAEAKIPTDMIVQNVSSAGRTDISFTVPGDDFLTAQELVQAVVREIGAEGVECDQNVSKVSVVGVGMQHQSGVARRMFHALSEMGINIHMITTSEIKISALVSRENGVAALRAVHKSFQLDKLPEERVFPYITSHAPVSTDVPEAAKIDEFGHHLTPSELISHLTGMEDVLIEKVSLNQAQARLTLVDLPDCPGLATAIFDRLAQSKTIVDLIVQSVGRDKLASISFTVDRKDFEEVYAIMKEINEVYNCKTLTNSRVDKLSVYGTGLRSNTGLAYRMFKTVADNGINVSIISTSERSVSIIIDDTAGTKGYDALTGEFAKEMI